MTAHSDDVTILKRAQAGDPQAFGALFERHAARVFATCFHHTGHRQDAEDCLQETFIKAWNSLDRFAGRAAFATWLHRIAVNCCLDHHRKAARKRTDSLDQTDADGHRPERLVLVDDGPLPDQLAERKETSSWIRGHIDRLPQDMRTVLILIDLEACSYQEAAQLLDVSMGTVKSRLSRARTRLMQQIQREQDGGADRQRREDARKEDDREN
ncbi:MAG: sigma-70 family RNA polymerase sigma factor [Armatimonadetes bacterium]|nr:sigma-70 family RNA polymerase sigma factor [Armatimonadota bacterium]